MKRKCVLCNKDFTESGGHEHHIIPKFLNEIGLTKENLDNYRIILCEEHHKEITEIWSKIFKKLKLIW